MKEKSISDEVLHLIVSPRYIFHRNGPTHSKIKVGSIYDFLRCWGNTISVEHLW